MWRKLFVALLVSVLALALAGGADAAKKKKKAAAPPAPARIVPIYDAPMRVVVVHSSDPSCEDVCPEWIAAEGEITGATPGQFAKVFKQIGKRKLPVIIRSPGGSITAALEIGRMIRKRGLDVSLGWTFYSGCAPDKKSCVLPKEQKGVYRGMVLSMRAFCNSACHLVLASGTTRLASAETYVGVHQPRTVWTREIITYRERYRIINGKKKVIDRKIVGRKPGKSRVTYGHDKSLRKKLTAFYKEMGISPKVLEESDKAEFKDINYLTGIQLDDLKLRTARYGAERLVEPKVCKVSPVPGNCASYGKIGEQKLATPAKKREVTSELTPTAPMPEGAPMKLKFMRASDLRCEPLCPEWISAKGVITEETPQQFETILSLKRAIGLPIVIESKGGDFDAAMAIARRLQMGNHTVVSGHTALGECIGEKMRCANMANTETYDGIVDNSGDCYDSCALILSAGKRRLVILLKLRNPKTYATRDDTPASLQIHRLFEGGGISSNLIQEMRSIRPELREVFFDTTLLDYHMATAAAPPSIVSSSKDCQSSYTACRKKN